MNKKKSAAKLKKPDVGQEEKTVRQMVEIRAEKVRITYPPGLVVVHKKFDIIEDPWPELLQVAHLDEERRVFAIIEKK